MFPGGNSNTFLFSDEQYTLFSNVFGHVHLLYFFSKYIINPLRTLGFFPKIRVDLSYCL